VASSTPTSSVTSLADRGGRPRRITPAQRQRVVAVAGARPDRQGIPLTRWSLDRLAIWLGGQGIVEISPARLPWI
jgi:transposase